MLHAMGMVPSPNPSTAKISSIAPTNISLVSTHQTREVSPTHHSLSLPIAWITQCIHQISPLPPAGRTQPAEAPSAEKIITGPCPAPPTSKTKSVSAEKDESMYSSIFPWNLLTMITGAKQGRADTIGDSPSPARKWLKQKIISPEIVPSA